MSETEQRLKKVFARILGVNEDVINDETSMANTVSWDSLKHMELIVALEEEFKTQKFAIADIVTMTSIPVVKDILRNKGIQF